MPPSPQGEGFWQKIHLSKNKIEAPQSFDFERREWRRGYGDGEQRLNDVRRRNGASPFRRRGAADGT